MSMIIHSRSFHNCRYIHRRLKSELDAGEVDCLFATGTAAAVTYINELMIDDQLFKVNSDTLKPSSEKIEDITSYGFFIVQIFS